MNLSQLFLLISLTFNLQHFRHCSELSCPSLYILCGWMRSPRPRARWCRHQGLGQEVRRLKRGTWGRSLEEKEGWRWSERGRRGGARIRGRGRRWPIGPGHDVARQLMRKLLRLWLKLSVLFRSPVSWKVKRSCETFYRARGWEEKYKLRWDFGRIDVLVLRFGLFNMDGGYLFEDIVKLVQGGFFDWFARRND